MDFDDIGNKLANLTMYDVKQFYTAAKNYALNVSEIEAKVNEATNDDPWGASSTLMQDIAQATHNFQDFNEIMPAIYRNFMEREAREWRQIYKALQLLEYLIKHGSERVVDDARSHLGTIKILRNFHYIDEAGKDQGINVRNRAKEIAELLSDVERIRAERRKARSNRTKYQGAGNSDFIPGSGTGRYGGFGSDSVYSGSGGFSGGGGAYGGGSSSGAGARESFDEYDAGDFEERRAPPSSSNGGRSRPSNPSATPSAPRKKEEKVADLFSFDDEDAAPASQTLATAPPAPTKPNVSDNFDDFDDFQAAPSAPTATASASSRYAPTSAKPAVHTKAAGGAGNVFDFLGEGDSSSSPAPAITSPTTSSGGAKNNFVGSTPLAPQVRPQTSRSTSTVSSSASPTNAALSPSQQQQPSSLNFDDLWASSAGKSAERGNGATKGKLTMADLAKQKSNTAVWGSGQQQQPKKSDPFDFL